MGRRLLIVDDIATNRIVLKVKLAAACYDTVQAANGDEALRRARADRPDLILLDLGLPDIDGLEVLRRLRADPVTRDTPVIVISAHTGAEARIAALNAGADEILPKPVDDPVLLARVRSLLRAREAAQVLGAGKEAGLQMPQGARDPAPSDLAGADFIPGAYHANEADLGLSEPAATFATQGGLIALIAPDETAARTWREHLEPLLPDRVIILNREAALAAADGGVVPDIYVISAALRGATDGLRLMSDLRSRPGSHHAAICIVVPGSDRDTAAMALDLGASDLLPAEASAEEIALRLRVQMRQKRASDASREQLRDQLRLAMQDPLTGLYNRHYALPQMARIADQARRKQQAYAVLLLDLDRFKSVNDRHGHVAGDHVLAEVARRLRLHLRPGDLLARIGGEEFLVVLPDATPEAAQATAERLCRAIDSRPFDLPDGSGPLRMTISVGVALDGGAGQAPTPPQAAGPRRKTNLAAPGSSGSGRAVAGQIALPTPSHPGPGADHPSTDRARIDDPATPAQRPATACMPSGSAIERADHALLSAKARGRNQVSTSFSHP